VALCALWLLGRYSRHFERIRPQFAGRYWAEGVNSPVLAVLGSVLPVFGLFLGLSVSGGWTHTALSVHWQPRDLDSALFGHFEFAGSRLRPFSCAGHPGAFTRSGPGVWCALTSWPWWGWWVHGVAVVRALLVGCWARSCGIAARVPTSGGVRRALTVSLLIGPIGAVWVKVGLLEFVGVFWARVPAFWSSHLEFVSRLDWGGWCAWFTRGSDGARVRGLRVLARVRLLGRRVSVLDSGAELGIWANRAHLLTNCYQCRLRIQTQGAGFASLPCVWNFGIRRGPSSAPRLQC
jgi:hypothetical protein